MTTIKLDPGAALLLDALHGAGHAAYAVGGCVRDSLLGLDPHDWDLCTSARPEQVMALFGAEKCIPTGLQHGTVTVKQGGRLYETTTFRTEGAYSDGRHPDAVCFVPDVREDLARRDFTINAMAYSAEEGSSTPLAGGTTLPPISCGRWGSRNAALRRTRCASCGSTGSRPGSVLPSTQPPVLLPGRWGRIWTAFRRSASMRNCSSCWRHPGPEAIWNPPFWPLSCRSWNRKNSRNGLQNSAVPSTGSNQQRRMCPPGWRPFSGRWVKPVPAKLCAN